MEKTATMKKKKKKVLTSYSSCMKNGFNNNKKLMKEKRVYFHDILLKGIIREMDIVDRIVSDDSSTSLQSPLSSKNRSS